MFVKKQTPNRIKLNLYQRKSYWKKKLEKCAFTGIERDLINDKLNQITVDLKKLATPSCKLKNPALKPKKPSIKIAKKVAPIKEVAKGVEQAMKVVDDAPVSMRTVEKHEAIQKSVKESNRVTSPHNHPSESLTAEKQLPKSEYTHIKYVQAPTTSTTTLSKILIMIVAAGVLGAIITTLIKNL